MSVNIELPFEEVVSIFERDFPHHEWLVRLNNGPEGKYFANAVVKGIALPLRRADSPPPQFSDYGSTPTEALRRSYMKLAAVTCD